MITIVYKDKNNINKTTINKIKQGGFFKLNNELFIMTNLITNNEIVCYNLSKMKNEKFNLNLLVIKCKDIEIICEI